MSIAHEMISLDPNEYLLLAKDIPHSLDSHLWENYLIDAESLLAKSLEAILDQKNYIKLSKLPEKLNMNSINRDLHEKTIQALELIKSHQHNCRLEHIASQVAISPDRLRHLFKENIGITFKNYIKWQKIRKAFYLLQKTPQLSLAQVAIESGFSDQAHMSRVIKENFGHSPKSLLLKIGQD